MQKAILGLIVTFAAVSCAGVNARTPDTAPYFHIEETGTPYLRVTSGSVSGLVPHGWQAIPIEGMDVNEGFVASPHPDTWFEKRPNTVGVVASWVDATQVGVASDLYYLPATGPVMAELGRRGCADVADHVFANHVPSYLNGPADSTADYVARGSRICRSPQGRPLKWSYFVAAPGFGPVGHVGIPGSGLYIVVVASPVSPRGDRILKQVLDNLRFGGDGIGDFVRALRRGTDV